MIVVADRNQKRIVVTLTVSEASDLADGIIHMPPRPNMGMKDAVRLLDAMDVLRADEENQ